MKENWKPIITIYFDEEHCRVGSRVVNDFDLEPTMLAGILINVYDMLVDKMPEQKQVPFEENVKKIFLSGLEERFNYTGKEKYE